MTFFSTSERKNSWPNPVYTQSTQMPSGDRGRRLYILTTSLSFSNISQYFPLSSKVRGFLPPPPSCIQIIHTHMNSHQMGPNLTPSPPFLSSHRATGALWFWACPTFRAPSTCSSLVMRVPSSRSWERGCWRKIGMLYDLWHSWVICLTFVLLCLTLFTFMYLSSLILPF